MAVLFDEDFEAGSNGAAVSAANSDFDSAQANIAFTNTPAPPQGSLWMKVNPSSGVSRYAEVTHALTPLAFYRWYFRIDAAPTGAVDMVATRGSNGARNRVGLTTGRLVTMRNGSTTVWTSPSAVAAGDTHRAELRIDNTNGQQQLRLFLGANRHGSTPDMDSGSRTYNQGQVDTLRLGQVNNNGLLVSYYDAVQVDSAAWVGGLSATPVSVTATFSAAAALSGVLALVSNEITADFPAVATLSGSLIAIPALAPRERSPFPEWVMFSRGVDYVPDEPLKIISAKIVKRHLGVSRAAIETPYSAAKLAALQPGRGIVIYRDGVQEFSGLVADLNPVFDAQTARDVLKVQAVGDEQHLADRLVFPDPLRAADDQTVNDYWRTRNSGGTAVAMAASTGMAKLISDQAGPTARADRRVSGLTPGVDPGVGVSRIWSALFNSVLDQLTLMSVASGADLGIRMITTAGHLTADIIAPRDLSESVRFSTDLSNLAGVDYRMSAPTVTHALSAGQGDLHARLRKLATTSDPLALIWGRQIWTYIDRRDTADVDELLEAATDALADGGPSVSLAVTLLDSDAGRYGVDWGLGDRVTVHVGRPGQARVATVTDVVREIALEVSPAGESIRPAIGTWDAKAAVPTPTQQALHTFGLTLAGLIARK